MFGRYFGSLLAWVMAKAGANTAALVRTSVGVTRMNAGTADNVLPDTGSVMFNFRLLPGAVLCCAVLCCAVLCCAVLCSAVLCCAVLCCAVLCWPGLAWPGLAWPMLHCSVCRSSVSDHTAPCHSRSQAYDADPAE